MYSVIFKRNYCSVCDIKIHLKIYITILRPEKQYFPQIFFLQVTLLLLLLLNVLSIHIFFNKCTCIRSWQPAIINSKACDFPCKVYHSRKSWKCVDPWFFTFCFLYYSFLFLYFFLLMHCFLSFKSFLAFWFFIWLLICRLKFL